MADRPNQAPLSFWFDTVLRTLLTAPSTYTPADFDPDQPLWRQVRVRGLVDGWLAQQDLTPAWGVLLHVVERGTHSGSGVGALLDAVEGFAAEVYAAGFADGLLWGDRADR